MPRVHSQGMPRYGVKNYRWPATVGMLILSLCTAFLLRDVVHELVVVPLAYAIWLLGSVYAVVPQFVTWSALVLAICLAGLSQLIPAPRPGAQKSKPRNPEGGLVEPLAIWVHRARASNYFRWQLANRMGRIARNLPRSSRQPAQAALRASTVEQYLAAGVAQSFVDFPGPRHPFQRAVPTPLDIDPVEVVDYLESQMEMRRGRHAQGL